MANTIPTFDFASRAQITRKALERFACFSMIQSSSSESGQLLDKTLTKINGLVKLLDSSILTAEFAYEFASTATIACDKESKEDVGKTIKHLSSLASKGSDLALEVATGFKGIEQAVYKIAASTKDSMLPVHIPPDPAQTKTVHKHLKDVGTDLVANLKVFSQFSRAAEEIAEWWSSVKKELVSESPALPHLSASESRPGEINEQFVLWSNMKENLWEYYITVNVAQLRFPDLLSPSIAAWQSAASARNGSDPKTEESHQPQSTPNKGNSIRQLLSRFLERRIRNTKVRARPDNEERETEIGGHDLIPSGASDNLQGKEAPGPVSVQQTTNKNGKIQSLFTACNPICKCI